MKYEDIKSQIKTGDIVFFGRSKKMNNCGVAIKWQKRLFIVAVNKKIVGITPLSNLKRFMFIPLPYDKQSGNLKEAKEWLVSQIGRSCGKEFFSSLLCCIFLQKAGKDYILNHDGQSPAILANTLSNLPYTPHVELWVENL